MTRDEAYARHVELAQRLGQEPKPRDEYNAGIDAAKAEALAILRRSRFKYYTLHGLAIAIRWTSSNGPTFLAIVQELVDAKVLEVQPHVDNSPVYRCQI